VNERASPDASNHPIFSAKCQTEEHNYITGISVYEYELKSANEDLRSVDRQKPRSKHCNTATAT